MSSTTTDPNGWVTTNPPSTFVTIHAVTSRVSLNGQYGLVLQYIPTTERYTILLRDQQQVSLRAANLTHASGYLDKARAYYQFLQPQFQQQYLLIKTMIQQHTGMSFQTVAIAVLACVLIAIYVLGITRVLLLLSFLVLIGMVAGPDLVPLFQRSTSPVDYSATGRRVYQRWKNIVQTQIPVIGPKLVRNDKLFQWCTSLFVVFFVYSFIVAGGGNSSKATTTRSTTLQEPYPNTYETTTAAEYGSSSVQEKIDELQKQHYYNVGYQDGTKGNDHGTSIQSEPFVVPDDLVVQQQLDQPSMNYPRGTTESSEPFDFSPPPASSPWSISTIMAMITIGRTVYELGHDPSSPTMMNSSLLMTNVQQLPVWKLGFLGLAVYRVTTAFLF